MIRYDTALAELKGNFFVICANVTIYLSNCQEGVEFNIPHAKVLAGLCC